MNEPPEGCLIGLRDKEPRRVVQSNAFLHVRDFEPRSARTRTAVNEKWPLAGPFSLNQPAGRSAGAPPANHHGPVRQGFPYRDCATPSPLAKRFALPIVAALAPPAVAPVVAIPANPHAHTGPFDGHA